MNNTDPQAALDTFENKDPFRVFNGYRFYNVFGKTTALIRGNVQKFWQANNILPADIDPEARARQLAIVCVNDQNHIAGVSTAYKGSLAKHGVQHVSQEPYIFYRTFVQPQDRIPYMAETMTVTTYEILNDIAEMKQFHGMVIIPDNPKLLKPGIRRRFEKENFEVIGQTGRGTDVYCRYFTQ